MIRKQLSIIFCTVLLISTSVKAQDKAHILFKGGIGTPELLGLNIGLQVSQVQLTLGSGIFPSRIDRMYSINGDVYIHLFGYSQYSKVKPYYVRSGFCYFNEKALRWIDQYTYWDIRIGRTFFISEKLALEADIGVAVELSYERENLVPNPSLLLIDFPVLPAIGTRLVYRIGI